MDDDIVYLDMAYCTLCDRYFPGSDARRHHVQVSTNHPKCDTCDRRFANMNALRNVSFVCRLNVYTPVLTVDTYTRSILSSLRGTTIAEPASKSSKLLLASASTSSTLLSTVMIATTTVTTRKSTTLKRAGRMRLL